MLILTRKINEEIIINSEIRIKILSISENQIKLGISAPENMEILRGEIFERVKQIAISLPSEKVSAEAKIGEEIKDFSKLKVNKISK
ncbi:MAG: carbon storage regulator CsrA [Ignavibacteriaceae bacterium]